MAVDRHLLARLKKLLLARDVDLISQGVEFVSSLDDEELWDLLLAGVDYLPEAEEPQHNGTVKIRPPEWVRNPLFTGTAPAQPYHDLALTLLVANAPSGALRDRVDALVVRSWDGGWPRTYFERMPLDGIERYPNLRKLTVQTAVTTDLSPIGGCPALEWLRVEGGGRVELAGVGRCRALKRVEIVAQLDSTAGIEGAPLESIAIHSRCLRDLRGLGATPVRTVELFAGRGVDVSDLARAKHLTSLSTDRFTADVDLGPLRGAPELTRLELWGSATYLPTLPALTTLFANELGKCDAQPALTSLAVVATAALPELSTAMPAVTDLWIRSSKLSSFAFLRGASGLRRLRLEVVSTDDAAALGTLDGLEELSMHRLAAPALDHLPSVQLYGPPGEVRHTLDLSGTPVRSVRGIASLVGVEIVDLHGCTALETLDGLEGTDIKVVDIRGCSALADVSALAEMPELRMVAARGTRFHAGVLPDVRATVSLANAPDLEAARRKPLPKAPSGKGARKGRIPVPEAQRDVWERIQPLLAATTPEALDALLAVLTAEGTAEICDLLLASVTTERNRWKARGRLLPMDQELRPAAVQRIAGLCLGEVSERLRSSTTALTLDGRTRRRGMVPVDLRGLRGFRALTALTVNGRGAVGLEELADHPTLVELRAEGLSLDALGALPTVQVIHDTQSSTTRLDFARTAPSLTTLSVVTAPRGVTDLSGLRDHPSLTQLDVRPVAADVDLSVLPTLRRLTRLGLSTCGLLPALDALTALEAVVLRPSFDLARRWLDLTCLEGLPAPSLHLQLDRPVSTVGLARLNKVERLILTGTTLDLVELPPNLVRLELNLDVNVDRLPELRFAELVVQRAADIGFVSRVRGLRHLEVYARAPVPLDVLADAPDLETLKLNPCAPTTLAPLVGHPRLRSIQVPRWRAAMVDVPDGLTPAVEWT